MLKNSRRLQKGETTQRAGSLGAKSSNDAGRGVSIAATPAMTPWSHPSHARRVHQIAVRETFVAYNHGTAHDRDGAIEDRAIVHERVELAVLATGVGTRWQRVQQRTVETPPRERPVDLGVVRTDDRGQIGRAHV